MPGSLKSPEMARRAVALQPALRVLFTSGYIQNAIERRPSVRRDLPSQNTPGL